MASNAIGASRIASAVPQCFPSLAPALLISMEFIDLGKWVVAIEGGAHFGSSLLLLALFNCCAIFCQYLSSCIGVVTRKNLAQICCEEYCWSACLLLGLQAEVSIVVSDITNILGIAHGFNLLFGLDLFKCIILAAVVAAILPLSVRHLGKHNIEVLYICISSFVLVFYVLGVLIAQPEISLVMNGLFPRLTGESSCLIMALLGSNIIVHNFYTQSSMVQHQRKPVNVDVNPLLHDHFFAILFIFSGIFLVNSVLTNSATLFESASLVNFQDVFLLMDQMFGIHIAPLAFLLVLLFSSLMTALTWNHVGRVVMQDFFGLKFSGWVSTVCLKSLAILPVIYYAQSSGAEGLYQLLIFCQVMLAMLLPSSVIPLFRVASSRHIMGSHNMSWYLELFALFTFIWMLASNIVFIVELLSGNSSWVINLNSSLRHSFFFLLLIGCISLGLTLHLMVTPLKSASDESNIQIWKWELLSNKQEASHGKEDDLNSTVYGHSRLFGIPEEIAEPVKDSYQSISDLDVETASTLSASDAKQLNSVVDLHPVEVVNKLLVSDVLDPDVMVKMKSDKSAEGNASLQTTSHTQVFEGGAWEPDDFTSEAFPSGTSEESCGCSKTKVGDIDSETGSLSRLSGLGRAARRQFSAILDEFWGHFFDFHGKLTQEACANKVDILLGLDLKTSSVRTESTDISGSEALKRHLPDAERGPVFTSNSRDYNSLNKERMPNKGMPYDVQKGSPSWLLNRHLLPAYGQGSHDVLEPGERRYSSLHLPQYADNRDYQPATFHGYQISSYLRGYGADRLNSSVMSLDQATNPKSSEPFVSNYRDSPNYSLGQDRLGSPFASAFEGPALTRLSRLQDESAYHDFMGGSYENLMTSGKKYHSLPDISGRTVSSRNSSLNNRNIHQGGRIGPHPSIGRMTFEQLQSSNLGYRAEGAPLTFDELSPSNIYEDIFSPQLGLNTDAKSLWSKQPFEQLFGVTRNSQNGSFEASVSLGLDSSDTSYAALEVKLLKSLKVCILKLLKLEGSDWLIREDCGADEELINKLLLKEKYQDENDTGNAIAASIGDYPQKSEQELCLVQRTVDMDLANVPYVCKCGESCVLRTGLIVSFGVWCIRRILELSLVESRPELWGKYTYVLNRLQGILELAFSKHRYPLPPCACLEIPEAYRKDYDQLPRMGFLQYTSKLGGTRCTSSLVFLDIVKDVEHAISSRKGRMGTAAGDVAFPKGKENLASVLKRYKRRLSNKSPATHQVGLSVRKVPPSTTSVS